MNQRRPLPRLIPLVAAVLTGLPGWALAQDASDEPTPFYFGVTQQFTGDTNVYRAPKDRGEAKDIISATGLIAGFDQPIGRLRLGAKGVVAYNAFTKNDQLNNTSHDVQATLAGSTIERISGDMILYDRSNLNRYDLSSTEAISTAKDMLHVTGGNLRARIGLVTMLTLEGGYAFEQSEHSLDDFSNRDVRQGAYNLGLRVAPSDLWSLRLGYRHTDGKYPHFQSTGGSGAADQFDRDDIDLSATWVPTGNSKFDGRISHTEEKHSLQGARNSRYITGLVGYDWTLTGKTRMRFQYARDSGAGRSDSDLGILTESSDTQIRNAFNWRTWWDATSKITVTAGLGYSRRTLDNAFSQTSGGVTVGQATTAKDSLANVGLSVGYQALRNLRIGCGLSYEERSVDGDNVNTTYPYNVTTGNCNLSLMFR